jgi:hypothetical protein
MLKITGNQIDIKIIKGKFEIPDKTQTPNLYHKGKDVYLWWDDIGQVKISDGEKIIVEPNKNDENKIIPFILGPVMAAVLHQRGFTVLHGSSIKFNDFAIAFIGFSGYGKSTTAIHLYKKGYPLLTDDILALKFNEKGYPTIYPGYPHVRLSDQTYSEIKDTTNMLTSIRTIADKGFYDSSKNFQTRPIPLKGIYLLEKSDDIDIIPVRSQEDLMELLIHSTAQRIFTKEDQANNLIQCANLINKIHFKRLKTNHSFKDINKLIGLIEEDLSDIH